MALKSEGRKIFMDEKDYGEDLPFTITGYEFEPNDKFLFIITKNRGATNILEKEYSNLSTDLTKFSFVFSLTEKESLQLSKGFYNYSVIFLRDNEQIRSTVIANEDFKVSVL